MRQTRFSHQIVQFIPEHLEEGVLYVSLRYKTAVHKCACGCGEEVVTPLNPADWSIQIKNGTATLNPSIGSWSFACCSHYFIRNGRVVWAGPIGPRQIERGRVLDGKTRDEYIEKINRERSLARRNFLYKAWMALKRRWMFW